MQLHRVDGDDNWELVKIAEQHSRRQQKRLTKRRQPTKKICRRHSASSRCVSVMK